MHFQDKLAGRYVESDEDFDRAMTELEALRRAEVAELGSCHGCNRQAISWQGSHWSRQELDDYAS